MPQQKRRINGQVWISKEQPHTLKYFANNIEYWGVAATTYESVAEVRKGMVVAPAGDQGRVRPAQWPIDVDKTVGIAIGDPEDGLVRVLNYGYIEFSRSQLEQCFVTASDLNVGLPTGPYTSFGNMSNDGAGGNGWDDALGTRKGRGVPVYWFSGRTLKDGVNYPWIDPSAALTVGKLTLATPSGYKGPDINSPLIPYSDQSLNIGYKDIPTIGNIVDYTYDGSGQIETMIMHVNFTKFRGVLRFEYPAVGTNEYLGPSPAETMVLRHGLFANGLLPHVMVKMWGYSDNDVSIGDTSIIYPGFESRLIDKLTEVEIQSDSSFFYKVLGEVSYNL